MFALIVVLVFANILLPRYVNVAIIALLVIFFCLIFMHTRAPSLLPAPIGRLADRAIVRLQVYPGEIMLIVAVSLLVIVRLVKRNPTALLEAGLEAASCLVLITAFWMRDKKSQLSGAPAILPRPNKEAEKRAPSEPEDEPISAREIKVQGLDKSTEIDLPVLEDEGAVERKQYENAQKKRWEGWLKEEIDRLENK